MMRYKFKIGLVLFGILVITDLFFYQIDLAFYLMVIALCLYLMIVPEEK